MVGVLAKMKHVCVQGKLWGDHKIKETEELGRYIITYSSPNGSHYHIRYMVKIQERD